jgi:hypothetical protein
MTSNKSKTALAYQIGVWMFASTFSVLGIALCLKLSLSAESFKAYVSMPWVPNFIVLAASYIFPIFLAGGGLLIMIPKLRNLAYNLLTVSFSIFSIAQIFSTRGPRVIYIGFVFILVVALMITAWLDAENNKSN